MVEEVRQPLPSVSVRAVGVPGHHVFPAEAVRLLDAFFPVNGNPNQVYSAEVEIVNSVGTAKTGVVDFTTP